jgi:hypothetical protein
MWTLLLLAFIGCGSESSLGAGERAEAAIKRVNQIGGSVVWESEIFAVTLSSTQVADDDLAILADLSDVQLLSLSHTSITDAGLRHLEHLSKLQTLELIDTKVTEKGLEKLRTALPATAICTSIPSDAVNPFTGKPWSEQQ